jgi:hypothetical protein
MGTLLLPFRVFAKRARLRRVAAGPESIPARVATQGFRRGATAPRLAISAALIALLLGGCTREKDLLDEQVRQMCAKDGGIKVYETVRIPPQMFDKFGVIMFDDASDKRPLGSRFILEEETKYIKKGNPSLRREHAKIIRSSDGRLLGEFTSYHRVGGDLPGPWHESIFACPSDIGTATLERSVFQIEIARE